jgi:hypothetical protein
MQFEVKRLSYRQDGISLPASVADGNICCTCTLQNVVLWHVSKLKKNYYLVCVSSACYINLNIIIHLVTRYLLEDGILCPNIS